MNEETKIVNDITVTEEAVNTEKPIDIKKPLIVAGAIAGVVGIVKFIKSIPDIKRKAKANKIKKATLLLEKNGCTVIPATDEMFGEQDSSKDKEQTDK